MSQEYIAALALILGAILKATGLAEIDNKVVESVVAGALSLWIAIRRKQRGDINILGMKR